MRTQIRVAARLLGAIALVGLALFSGYGFLASFEPGFGDFPNVFHTLFGAASVAAIIGAVWLTLSAFRPKVPGTADSPVRSYWRPSRLFALFSLFSLFAFIPGFGPSSLTFLLFLMFLLPFPGKPRTQT
jgi:hypothetical protein